MLSATREHCTEAGSAMKEAPGANDLRFEPP